MSKKIKLKDDHNKSIIFILNPCFLSKLESVSIGPRVSYSSKKLPVAPNKFFMIIRGVCIFEYLIFDSIENAQKVYDEIIKVI